MDPHPNPLFHYAAFVVWRDYAQPGNAIDVVADTPLGGVMQEKKRAPYTHDIAIERTIL
jgi:hypothetical protein